MDKKLRSKIKKWIKDYEATQPSNLIFDDDTFDGSAYFLFQQILSEEGKP